LADVFAIVHVGLSTNGFPLASAEAKPLGQRLKKKSSANFFVNSFDTDFLELNFQPAVLSMLPFVSTERAGFTKDYLALVQRDTSLNSLGFAALADRHYETQVQAVQVALHPDMQPDVASACQVMRAQDSEALYLQAVNATKPSADSNKRMKQGSLDGFLASSSTAAPPQRKEQAGPMFGEPFGAYNDLAGYGAKKHSPELLRGCVIKAGKGRMELQVICCSLNSSKVLCSWISCRSLAFLRRTACFKQSPPRASLPLTTSGRLHAWSSAQVHARPPCPPAFFF
jgi:hypothetical protein